MSYTSPPVRASLGMSGELMLVAPRSIAPTPEDWERHRSFIKQLYLDQNRTLKEVSTIMAQHGHHATPKMFKDRIRKWKIDKKHKKSDMLAILRRQNERDAIGKKTAFRVRGRTVTIEQVHQYFQRKTEMRDHDVHYALTPSDVSYRTPSPMPVKCPVDDNTHQMAAVKSYPNIHIDHNSLLQNSSHICGNVGITAAGWTEAPPQAVTEGDYIFQLRSNDMYNLLSEDPSVAHSLISPRNLLIPERLFLSIKTYMDGSFERELGPQTNWNCAPRIAHLAKSSLMYISPFHPIATQRSV